MRQADDKVLLYGFGNPARGDDGLGPALVEAIAALALPGVRVDANYQLTVEDAAEMGHYQAVVFVDAATDGPSPFWFSRIDDSGVGRLGFSSHSVTPAEVVALARDLFGTKVAAYALGIRGHAFGEFDEGLSVPARDNLDQAVAFARKALAERRFEEYVQEFGYPAAGLGGSTWKA
ncbi:MAG: hydrogenase maturation protease [Deltaproteobacteria bacterium]|jgi:hydrogenase maturation protease|nr:hydrogenase maturation protease [Deltaproteobacteria bacterium]